MPRASPDQVSGVGRSPKTPETPQSIVERMSCRPRMIRVSLGEFLRMRPIIWGQLKHLWRCYRCGRGIRRFEARCIDRWSDYSLLFEAMFTPTMDEWWAFKKSQALLRLPPLCLERLMAGIVREFLREKGDRVLFVALWIFTDLMTRLINNEDPDPDADPDRPPLWRRIISFFAKLFRWLLGIPQPAPVADYLLHRPAALKGLLSGLNRLEEEGRLADLAAVEKHSGMIVECAQEMAAKHDGLGDLARQIKEKLQ